LFAPVAVIVVSARNPFLMPCFHGAAGVLSLTSVLALFVRHCLARTVCPAQQDYQLAYYFRGS
jgi:hypothetical protein